MQIMEIEARKPTIDLSFLKSVALIDSFHKQIL